MFGGLSSPSTGAGPSEIKTHNKVLVLNTDVSIFSFPVATFDYFGATMDATASADDGTNIAVTTFHANLALYNKLGTSPDESGNINANESKFASDGANFISVQDNSTLLIKNALSAGVVTFSARLNTFGLTPTVGHIYLYYALSTYTAQVITFL